MEPPSPAAVFVSCAAADDFLAAALCRALDVAGLASRRHQERALTAAYLASNQEWLDQAAIILVIWTHASIRTAWVVQEADEGARRKVLVNVEADGARAPIGFGDAQSIRVRARNGTLSRYETQLIVDRVVDVLPDAFSPTLPRQHGWRHRLADATATALLVCTMVALAAAAVGVCSVPLDFSWLWCLLVVPALGIGAAWTIDAIIRRTRAKRRGKLHLALRWGAEAFGIAAGFGMGVALTWTRPMWEFALGLFFCVFLIAALLTPKYLMLAGDPVLRRRVLR